jgi:hypothetical protein
VNAAELALHHQRLAQHASHLRTQIERIESRLAEDPEARRLEDALEQARGRQKDAQRRLRASEQQAEDHRQHVRGRDRELMSGRIRNSGELMKLSDEVARLRQGLAQVEDAELILMEETEQIDGEVAELEKQLAAVREALAAAAPGLEKELADHRAELEQVESERAATWEQIPPEWRLAYERVRARSGVVAEVIDGQCQGCHVSVTSSGAQVLRRGGLITCDNCGRLLVLA